jgi:hypothetical protein
MLDTTFLPDYETLETNALFAGVVESLEMFIPEDLGAVAGPILALAFVDPKKPLAEHSTVELRDVLKDCVDFLRRNDRDTLRVVYNLVDAIARARVSARRHVCRGALSAINY